MLLFPPHHGWRFSRARVSEAEGGDFLRPAFGEFSLGINEGGRPEGEFFFPFRRGSFSSRGAEETPGGGRVRKEFPRRAFQSGAPTVSANASPPPTYSEVKPMENTYFQGSDFRERVTTAQKGILLLQSLPFLTTVFPIDFPWVINVSQIH